jgi:hypothetical protein
MRRIPSARCLACGGTIEAVLFRLGSPRCLDCRQEGRPLDPELAGGALEPGPLGGNGHAPVSVTVRVSDAACAPELLEFLRVRACDVEHVRGDMLVVRPHPTLRAEHVRAELEVLLAHWRQARPDVVAVLGA